MTRKEVMRAGNVYELHDGSLAMVLEVCLWRNPLSGDYEAAAKMRCQDGTLHHCPVYELREHHPFMGLPKRVFQKRLSNGNWHERFQIEDGPSFSQTSAGHPSLAESRVAAWEATYAPKPKPEPQPESVNHILTRNDRLAAGRAALREWGQTPAGMLFWNGLWAQAERTVPTCEYFLDAVAVAVRDYLRQHGGWKQVRRTLEAQHR